MILQEFARNLWIRDYIVVLAFSDAWIGQICWCPLKKIVELFIPFLVMIQYKSCWISVYKLEICHPGSKLVGAFLLSNNLQIYKQMFLYTIFGKGNYTNLSLYTVATGPIVSWTCCKSVVSGLSRRVLISQLELICITIMFFWYTCQLD